MRDAFGVAGGVGDGGGTTLRNSEEGETVEGERVNDGLKVTHPRVEGNIRDVAIGEAGPAFVVADEAEILGQILEEMTPDGALPIELEVVEPVGGFDEERAVAHCRVGDAEAVIGCGEADVLIH